MNKHPEIKVMEQEEKEFEQIVEEQKKENKRNRNLVIRLRFFIWILVQCKEV